MLFTGGSGTGKTLAAEVIGTDLGLDLYVIDLSTVVDKYIGETEKNLERVFSEAEGVSAILFFDEADALFGKRSEVSDARDRYANLEVSYLLQRMEQFDGLAILATNLRGNLDEAFPRRLSTVVDFAEPDAALRLRLWHQQLAPVPLADDIDLEVIAEEYELTGGNIRSAAVTAAVSAAESGTSVTMSLLDAAVRHQYRKLGRLMTLPGRTGTPEASVRAATSANPAPRSPSSARWSVPRSSVPRSTVPRSSVPRSSVPRSSVPRSSEDPLSMSTVERWWP